MSRFHDFPHVPEVDTIDNVLQKFTLLYSHETYQETISWVISLEDVLINRHHRQVFVVHDLQIQISKKILL